METPQKSPSLSIESDYRFPSVPVKFYTNGLFETDWTLVNLQNICLAEAKAICLELLFSKGTNGRINFWQVGFDGVKYIYIRAGDYKIVNGQPEGLIETVRTPVLLNMTSRSVYENAIIKIRTRYIDKIRKNGYTNNPGNVVLANQAKPMLATFLDDGTNSPKPKKTLKKGLTWYVTAKLRGVRMMVSFNFETTVEQGLDNLSSFSTLQVEEQEKETGKWVAHAVSRGNKVFKHLMHIKQACLLLAPYLPPGSKLDGEAYVHGYNQQQIAKLVNVTASEKHPDEGKVMYFIFDIMMDISYHQRHAILSNAISACKADMALNRETCKADNPAFNNLFLIPYFVVNDSNMHLLKQYRDHYLSQGYEGIVMRKAEEGYYHGRSVKMYKYKDRDEAEGIILEVNEWPKRPGFPLFLVKHEESGKTFNVVMNGDEVYLRELFANRSSLIGKQITYDLEHDGITSDGIPKEGRGKAIRDYE